MRNKGKIALCLLLVFTLLFAQILPAAAGLHARADEIPGLVRGTFRYAGMYKSPGDSVLDYAYSDAYFEGDAREYNPSLSTMSLCFEMSSWSSYDEENWADKTVNARNLLTDLGFTDFAQNDFWNDSPTVESIGAVMAQKQLEDSTLIALAVRGGGYFSEWGSNVMVGADDEHTGFATARDNVVSFLNDYIEEHGIAGRVKVWLVGFSRGAAVANMTAGFLNQNGLTGEATLVPSDLYCYTFETPQGILEMTAGADADFSNIHNIVNPNDIVPLVAPDNWGFGRYNETSHLLPTITTSYYPEAYEQMMAQYAKILEGVELLNPDEAVYNISEYAKTLQLNVNCLSFFSSGAPFIEVVTVDNTHLPQSIMLVESVSALVNAAQSRENFHDNIEADLSTLLGDLLGVSGGATLSAYIQDLGDLLTANDYENLIYIIEPMLQLNLTSFDDRMLQVSERMQEIIPQPEGYTDIFGTVGSLTQLLANWLTTDYQSLLNLVLSLSSTNMIQAHYAEITLAWLRIEDPNFTDAPFTKTVPEAMRVVRVNCPVDLYVYDSSDVLVASIIGGECMTNVPGIGCAINPNGEMVLYLPSDAAYSVKIIATGDGTVNCSVNEFNVVRGRHTYAVNYPDVPIQTDDGLTLLLPELSDEEFTDEPAQGSNAAYTLLDNENNVISAGSILRGGDVVSYTIRAERNNQFGQVLGGGVYVGSSFVRLVASPVAGCEFLGWYVGDKLVSSDAEYRFPATQNLTVTAHFGEVDLYEVSFASSENGRILNSAAKYPAGSHVLLTASADEGYALSGWSASSGEIYTDESGRTFFIVPEGGATVSASFKKLGPVCPECQAILFEGESHRAPCLHYTCVPGYQAADHRFCSICKTAFICEGGHGYEEGECGSYECGGCDRALPNYRNHKADCDHYYCTEDYVEEEHAMCGNCGEFRCNGQLHQLSCGHYACSSGYQADQHRICKHCSAFLCDGNEHTLCEICEDGYLCQGGHGTGSGECGVYVCEGCGVEILKTISHMTECGHYMCGSGYKAEEHSVCSNCSGYLCNGAGHTLCSICKKGYVCQGGHGTGSGECGVYACRKCGEEMLITQTHARPCGHYSCQTNYYATGHNTCAYCGTLECNDLDHSLCEFCMEGHVCEGGHGYGECIFPEPSDSAEPSYMPDPSPTLSPGTT